LVPGKIIEGIPRMIVSIKRVESLGCSFNYLKLLTKGKRLTFCYFSKCL
jgi:hypothetical protein